MHFSVFRNVHLCRRYHTIVVGLWLTALATILLLELHSHIFGRAEIAERPLREECEHYPREQAGSPKKDIFQIHGRDSQGTEIARELL